jgi:hypothetical protein
MNDLLDGVYEAHGGLERWRRLTQVRFTGSAGGKLPWPRPDFMASTGATADTRVERVLFQPFGAPDRRGLFTPGHVEIQDAAGTVLAARDDPRQAFAAYPPGRLFDELDAAYSAGHTFWTYLTIPFLCAWDGVQAEGIEPWQENGETWRRLRVEFPDDIATQSTVQTLCSGPDNLLRRHDYSAEILGGSATAHYTMDYRTFDGFGFPTRRRVKRRQPDGNSGTAWRTWRRARARRSFSYTETDLLVHLAHRHSRPERPGPRHRPRPDRDGGLGQARSARWLGTTRGRHFVQEDSGAEIGAVIAGWLSRLP